MLYINHIYARKMNKQNEEHIGTREALICAVIQKFIRLWRP